VTQAEKSGPLLDEIKREAAKKAAARARIARWDLDVAVFLFVILILVIILLFQGVSVNIVSPVAIFGLAVVWLIGWRRGRQLYQSFYSEELTKLVQELEEKHKKPIEEVIEETVEEKVQKALRARWR